MTVRLFEGLREIAEKDGTSVETAITDAAMILPIRERDLEKRELPPDYIRERKKEVVMNKHITTVFVRRNIFVLIASVLFSMPLVWAPAAAAGGSPATVAVGYVSVGAPVQGAGIQVFDMTGRPVNVHATPSDKNGYFVMEFAQTPGTVRVVATGGAVSGGAALGGSLQAIVESPRLGRNAYINPVSTVIAAYVQKHPSAALADATDKVRRLFALNTYDPIGRELRHRVAYFDGLAFWQQANHEGGLDAYIARLVGEIERGGAPARFTRGGRNAPDRHLVATASLGEGAPSRFPAVLGTVASAVTIVSGVSSFVNDIIGWASGPQPSNAQILTAVQQMQTQLDQISRQLSSIEHEIRTDFEQLQAAISVQAYNQSVAPIKNLAGVVQTTEEHFEDLLNNKESPNFSQPAADYYRETIKTNINTIESQFNSANDVFHDALLSGGAASTSSAYYFLGQMLLGQSKGFMNPDGSAKLQNFASYVLYYQALAFNLIMRWETSINPTRASNTAANTVTLYLGSMDDAKQWIAANPPGQVPTAPPPSGTLHDQFQFLNGIDAVPAGTVVDSKTGLMWQWGDPAHIRFSTYLPAGTDCGYPFNTYAPNGSGGTLLECQNLQTGLNAVMGAVGEARDALARATGLSTWRSATLDEARAAAVRVQWSGIIGWESWYWIVPPEMPFNPFQGDNYWYDIPPYQRVVLFLIDEWDFTCFGPLSTEVTCTLHVGRSGATDDSGGYLLLVRPVGTGEQYWQGSALAAPGV